jgi:hypothetical protein
MEIASKRTWAYPTMSWSQSAVASGRASRDDTALMALIIYFHRTPAKQSKAKQSNAKQRKATQGESASAGKGGKDGWRGWLGWGVDGIRWQKNDGGIR